MESGPVLQKKYSNYQEQSGKYGERQHVTDQCSCGESEGGIQIQILRVSDRSCHTSEVGGDRLQDDHRDQKFRESGHV